MDFTLSWVDEVYHSPIDGRAYVASDGWRTYLHQEATDAADASKVRAVKSTGIRFLNAEDELRRRVEADALSEYIAKVRALIEAELGDAPAGAGFDVLVQLDLSPPRDAKPTLAARPEKVVTPKLSTIAEKLKTIAAPTIEGGTVSFQIELAVRGSAGESRQGARP